MSPEVMIYLFLLGAVCATAYCLFTGMSGHPRRWYDRAWRLLVGGGLVSWIVFLFLFGDS
jgi:hypothetical protein